MDTYLLYIHFNIIELDKHSQSSHGSQVIGLDITKAKNSLTCTYFQTHISWYLSIQLAPVFPTDLAQILLTNYPVSTISNSI